MSKIDYPEEFKGLTDPFQVFKLWMEEVKEANLLKEPTAFCLSTSSPDGYPSARVVLCKSIKEDLSLSFYTNYLSKKGDDLKSNPKASALFFWAPLLRQIKIEGHVTRLSREDSIQYWQSRPRDSQISQWVSNQSKPLDSRQKLSDQIQEASVQFEGKEVPCPPHWGGYQLSPEFIEFWIGRPNRLHDRIHYSKVQGEWIPQRLYP